MFSKPALITVALALMAAATPIVQEETGVRIPLTKRGSLTNADGTFNHERAILQNIKTHKFVFSEYNVHADSLMMIDITQQVPEGSS